MHKNWLINGDTERDIWYVRP